MEKQQKIGMQKLQFVIAIALGSDCRGVITRRQYNSPSWELSAGIVRGSIVLGGNCPWGNCPGGVVQGGIALEHSSTSICFQKRNQITRKAFMAESKLFIDLKETNFHKKEKLA